MMARILPGVSTEMGLPMAPFMYATDAMGKSERDAGGFGVVGKAFDLDVLWRTLEGGILPGSPELFPFPPRIPPPLGGHDPLGDRILQGRPPGG